jgi:hypothetical protein
VRLPVRDRAVAAGPILAVVGREANVITKNKERSALYWIDRVQRLIAKHSTPARTRGKYKGHGSTDSAAWLAELVEEVQADVRRVMGRGIAYDENMALASRLGRILVLWYATVHRAKSYDPHRPLATRREVNGRRAEYLANLLHDAHSDELMAQAFTSQVFNFPFGLGSSGGDFT